MRQLRRRCGALTAEQVAHIRSLARPRLEALAEALLDFQGSDDFNAWRAVGCVGAKAVSALLQSIDFRITL